MDDVLCISCFTVLFALGTCGSCHSSILGERDEGYGGAHVKGRLGEVWHARCFTCIGQCERQPPIRDAHQNLEGCACPLFNRDHILLPSGGPACVDCYDIRLSVELSNYPTRRTGPSERAPRRYGRPGELLPSPSSTRGSSQSQDAHTQRDREQERAGRCEITAAPPASVPNDNSRSIHVKSEPGHSPVGDGNRSRSHDATSCVSSELIDVIKHTEYTTDGCGAQVSASPAVPPNLAAGTSDPALYISTTVGNQSSQAIIRHRVHQSYGDDPGLARARQAKRLAVERLHELMHHSTTVIKPATHLALTKELQWQSHKVPALDMAIDDRLRERRSGLLSNNDEKDAYQSKTRQPQYTQATKSVTPLAWLPSQSLLPGEVELPVPPPASKSTVSINKPGSLGGMPTCPGCSRKVALIETGTVEGPEDARWHQACLRCGLSTAGRVLTYATGCGNNLDRSARIDMQGYLRCLGCLVSTPHGMTLKLIRYLERDSDSPSRQILPFPLPRPFISACPQAHRRLPRDHPPDPPRISP